MADPAPKLDFVVIGAQKAGSTFLQEAIGDHPDAFSPHGETPFFEDPDYTPHTLAPLHQALAPGAHHKLRGIKRPNYLGLPEVPARIAQHFPRAKLIAVLRDPRWRAVSAYYHLMRSGLLPVAPLEQGMRRVLDGSLDAQYPAAPQLVAFGNYAQSLERFDEHFPREQLLVALYEDIKQHPVALARQAYRFLGLDDTHDPAAAAAARPMPGIYSIPRQRFVAAFHPIGVEYFHHRTRMQNRRGLPGLVYAAAQAADRFILARLLPNRRPQPSPDLWKRLTDAYHDDIEQLEQRLDRPLDAWKN
ncbi:MAG: sulfotransferase domain-containing protein [Planctomycetota bacterium]